MEFPYGIMQILAASFAAAGMLLYFFALMVSHLFAFEVESNIIKLSVKKMMTKPLGFFCQPRKR